MEVEMEKSGKYNTTTMIGSAIATTIGIVLVGIKTYDYIGIILLSFGGVILALSLQAREKEITSDELTEWISGKSATLAFWATWSTQSISTNQTFWKPTSLLAS
ncbi:MAG: hypothetical protein PHU34_11470 [Candidatus Methanoperedens sp.]|nr:hypothetical protein [Candidatus Methanoperedens sp.]